MSAYYSENDPKVAAWLRELIKAGLIADGDVDERSIVDVEAADLEGYTQCHLFAGIGGWSFALRLAGWSDDTPVWTGSCPCQPFSTAGPKIGFGDKRHLWPEFWRLIAKCRPPTIFGEQVASKGGFEWLDGISDDLEAGGYAFGAAVLPAASVGAPHLRKRTFWVGTPVANPANGTPEAFVARKKAAVAKGCKMGLTVTDIQMQAKLAIGRDGIRLTSRMARAAALNPAHCRWLMGFPREWHSCGATVMQSYRKSRRHS